MSRISMFFLTLFAACALYGAEIISVVPFLSAPSPESDSASALELQTITDIIYDETRKLLEMKYQLAPVTVVKNSLSGASLPQSGMLEDNAATAEVFSRQGSSILVMAIVERFEKSYQIRVEVRNNDYGIKEQSLFQFEDVNTLESSGYKDLLYSLIDAVQKVKVEKRNVVTVPDNLSKSENEVAGEESIDQFETIRPYETYAYVSFGVSALSLISGVSFLFARNSAEDDYNRFMDKGLFDKAEDKRQDANSFHSLSITSFVLSGLTCAGGVVLLTITEEKEMSLMALPVKKGGFIMASFSF